ncbi:MAG: sugar ABC transporter substrate-binding protein [Chloroflexota bacterium]|nr:sugar ABC transporter substrate-binding protein [Chloroflexota bacterium]
MAMGSAALAGCAGSGSAESPAKRAEPLAIRFAASGNTTEGPVWTQVATAYNELKTGITVSFEPCTAGTGSAQDCLPVYFTQFVGGAPPDVWRVDDEPLPFYADKGMYHELDSLLARDGKEVNVADFFPRSLSTYRYDRAAQRRGQGKLYAIPFNTGGDMIWFNTQLFQEAGLAPPPADGNWTIDQFVDMARKTTSFEGGDVMRTAGLSARPTFRGNLGFLWTAGAKLLDANGKRWTFNIPETVRAYEWLVALRFRHRVVPGPDDFRGQGNPFLAGRAAMWSAFAVSRPDILARSDTVPNWDVTHYPKAPNGERYTRETSDGVGLPANPKQPDAAWTFVKYLASAEGMRVQAKLGRAVPARRSVANGPDYIRPDTPQHEENLVKALEYSRLQPVTPMFKDAERIVRRYEDAMFDPKAPLPPSRALQQLQDVLDKLERDRAAPQDWEPKS